MLESLLRCPESAESELFVFMDGPRNEDEKKQVEQVWSIIDNLKGFKEKHTYKSYSNLGLAQSVIEGVNEVFHFHDTVIVLEDDLVVSHDFLSFMNCALDFYREREDIWSISGYTPRLDILEYCSPHGVFLTPRAQCWGWATWVDRWKTVDWNVSDYDTIAHSKQLQREFNRGGDDLFRTLKMERAGRIESWAIRWAYAAARQHRWTLNPNQSKVNNIGLNSSDSHSGWNAKRHSVALRENITYMDYLVRPHVGLTSYFKEYHDLNIISKIGYFMRLHNLGYHWIKKIIN